MRSCEEFQERISAMLDGGLTEAEAAEVRAHIAECPECAAMYEAFAAISAADAEEVPDGLHAAVMTKVTMAQKAMKTQRKIVTLRPVLTTAACLVVIVGTLFAARTALHQGAKSTAETMVMTAAAGVEEPMIAMAAPAAAADAMEDAAPAEGEPVPMPESTAAPAFAEEKSTEAPMLVQKDNEAEGDAAEPELLFAEVSVTETNALGFFATLKKGIDGVAETGATINVRLSGDTVRRDDFVPKAGDSVVVEFSVWDEGAIPVVYATGIDE